MGLSGPLISTSLGFQRRGTIFSVTRQYPAGSIQGRKAAMCVVAKVLPMGFKNSVSLAQHVHRPVVARAAGQAKGHSSGASRAQERQMLSGMFSTECTLTILNAMEKVDKGPGEDIARDAYSWHPGTASRI